MSKKNLMAIMLGAMVAALICVAVGLILYIPATHTVLDRTAANYDQLSTIRAQKVLVGIILIGVGSFAAILPAIILLVILIISLITKIKNKNN